MNTLRSSIPRLARTSISAARTVPRASLSSSTPRFAASGGDHAHDAHDSHFDPPGGWLWGERPGEKAEKEGWETGAWVFVATWIVVVAAYSMKEDTSIQTWALEEARRRLEKEGFYDDEGKA